MLNNNIASVEVSLPQWIAASMTSISNCNCYLLIHPGSSALCPTVPLIEAESQPGASPSAIDRLGTVRERQLHTRARTAEREGDSGCLCVSLCVSEALQ